MAKRAIEFSFEDMRYPSEIGPVICHISSAVFDQAHAHVADHEPALRGLSRLAEMDSSGNSGPVCHREWQRRNFHQVPSGFPSRVIERYLGPREAHAIGRQAHPAVRGPTSVEPDHRVWNIRFFEQSDFVFGQLNTH